VIAPERVEAGARYPLVVDLAATDPPPGADGFVVTRTGKPMATGPEIARFMLAKYPIDGARISIVPAPRTHHGTGGARPGRTTGR
jgi:hypothetical protein